MSPTLCSQEKTMPAAPETTETPRVPLLIGGEPVVTGEWLDVMDPAAPKRLGGRVGLASEALSRRAVDAAQKASESWAALEPQRRAELLLSALGAVEAERAANAELLVRENGKVRREAEADLAGFIGRCKLACGLAGELAERRQFPRAE